MHRIRLSKRSVDDITPPEKGNLIVWDTEIKGFGLRISAKNRKAYFLHTRTREGKQFKITFGVHGAITAEQARDLCRKALGEVAGGDDPAAARKAARSAEQERRAAPTLADLATQYLGHHAQAHKREASAREDRRLLEQLILPKLGRKRVADLKHRDLADLHRELKSTPRVAR